MKTLLIVEDNLTQGLFLKKKLQEILPQSRIYYAQTLEKAEEYIKKFRPDILFLDIIIDGQESFSLLDKFMNIPFEVVFVSQYDKFAVKAFEISAVNYILKPVTDKQLTLTLHRLKEKFYTKRLQHEVENLRKVLLYNLAQTHLKAGKIAIPSLDKIYYRNLYNIYAMESDKNYTTIYSLIDENIISSKNLGYYEELLKDYGFFRIHKKYLINTALVIELVKQSGSFFVKFPNGKKLPVSQRNERKIKDYMANLL